jgi:magnesium transporter
MFAVRWRSDRGRTDDTVDAAQARRMLDSSSPGVCWLDVVSAADADLAAVAEVTGFTPLMLLDESRPNLHVDGNRVAMVLRSAEPDADRLRAVPLLIIASRSWIVTCRVRPPAGGDNPLDEAVARLAGRAPDEVRPAEVLLLVLDALVDRQMELSDDLDDRLVEVEEALLDAPESQALRGVLVVLRRDVTLMHRVASPLRRVLALLVNGKAPLTDAGDHAALRHIHDTVVQLREQINTQLALLTSLSQTQMAAASIRLNEVMKTMSSWGAILIVATLITGIYGMNFAVIPELRWSFGYPFALVLIAASTVVLYRFFKSRGWL